MVSLYVRAHLFLCHHIAEIVVNLLVVKAADNAQPPKKEPKDLTDDSEQNFSDHILEGSDLIVKCSKFCRDYKVSPIYFISQLSEHLYAMHERYAPKDKK